MRVINRKIVILLIGLLAVTCFSVVKASNDNVGFNFTILANGGISHCATARYRQTTYCDNQWKVKMTISGEGDGAITIFSLGRTDTGNRVSPQAFVHQGKGEYYTNAFPAANQTNVKLRGKDNNYNSNSYKVYGIWDEEVWD